MTSDMTNEEQPIEMWGQEDKGVRMAGYLDKRGKMVSCCTARKEVSLSICSEKNGDVE
jgi:hypothetical protein